MPSELLHEIQRFFADPAKAFGTIFAVLGYGGWVLVKLLIKDPTKAFLKNVASMPPAEDVRPAQPFPEMTGRLAALELEQAKIRAERDAWERTERDGVTEELTNVSTQLFAARQELKDAVSRHQLAMAEIRADYHRASLHELEQREAGERVHLRRIAELEAEVHGLRARLAFHDSQLEMKIERISVAIDRPTEKVNLRQGHDTDRSPPPIPRDGTKRRPR